jgi:transcriptional regulator with XRE-family HTH domain
MQAFRRRHGLSTRKCGAILGISGEAYRLKEIGRSRVTGAELAKLAQSQGETVSEAFPAYQPTEGELLFARQIIDAEAA